MAKTSYPLASVYGLLEPSPVVLLTTLRNEQPNVMPLSWHTMLEFEPPLGPNPASSGVGAVHGCRPAHPPDISDAMRRPPEK